MADAATRATRPATVLTPTQARLVILTTALGMFVGLLPSFALTLTIPTVARAFAVEVPTAQWVMTALFVAQAATMLPIGSAGDIFGRSRIFLIGYVVLIVGLVLTPLAFSMKALIFIRGIQGIGSGMLIVTAPALVAAMLPPEQRGRGVSLVLLGGWMANLIGQPLAGALVQYTAWYMPFVAILAPAAIGLMLALRLRPIMPAPSETGRRFDLRGAWLVAVAFGAFVVATGHGQEEQWQIGHTLEHVVPVFIASAAATIAYIIYARRAEHPILPLHLFSNRTLATASIVNTIVHMTMIMISFLMPFYLQNVLHVTPLSTAFFLVPMAITLNAMAYPSGFLYDRIGSRIPCAAAMILGAVLLLSYLGLNETSGFFDVLPRLIVAGLVMGLFVTPNTSAILGAVPRTHYALISGFEKASQNVGHAVGIVLSSTVATYYLGSATGSAVTPATYVSIVHGTAVIAGMLMALGAGIALLRRDDRLVLRREADETAPHTVRAVSAG
jgi:EmrB/QacA subfamily drug resistance transporter